MPRHDDPEPRCVECGGDLPIPDELVLLDTEQLRQILGLKTRQGVRDMIKAGRLPSVRVGKEHKVRRAALLDLFERQERSPRPASAETAREISKRLGRNKKRR